MISVVMLVPVAASAKPQPMGAFGGKQSRNTPIEVTSDMLEVLQEQNSAIFSGHVVAIQGNVRLKAEKMTVYYAARDDKTDKPAKKAKAAGKENAIKKIVAEGGVFLSTPEETASGTSGVYDVAGQQINLNDNVVLTRGKNVLKGDTLTYNFTTGKSKISGGNVASPAGKNGGRVRALFVPENNKAQ